MTSLPTIRPEERVTALAKIAEEDPRKAELALCELADAEGDKVVALLMEQSSPLTLATIFAEHDASSETIMSYLATPEQIVKAISMEPARWEEINSDNIDWILKGVQGMVISLLANRSLHEREEIIEAIWEDKLSADFLRLSMTPIDIDLAIDDEEEALPNSSEMIWRWIREASPEVAQGIIEDPSGFPVKELRKMAIKRLKSSKKTKKAAKDMFTPL